jgi:phosphate transport system substrate-binding protein
MKKSIIMLAALLSVLLVFAGCTTGGQSGATKTPTTAAATQAASEKPVEISLVGSTSVQPLAEKLGEAYMALHKNVTVTVEGGGSSVGVKTVGEGGCDIGTASRDIKESEKETYSGIVQTTICWDGIAIVVHPANTVKGLTKEQICAILTGEITNWSEVGGTNKDITVYTREASSGTRDALVSLLKLEDANKNVLITDNAIECNSNGVMKTNVAGNEGAIGYVSLGVLDETIQALTVDGVEASPENVLNGTYCLYRPFNFVTMGEPEGAVKDFIEFALSKDGQDLCAENYIPLS